MFAKLFFEVAKWNIIQNHIIFKYNIDCHKDSLGWNNIYSNGKWIHSTGENDWKHMAAMWGLSHNKVVQILVGR